MSFPLFSMCEIESNYDYIQLYLVLVETCEAISEASPIVQSQTVIAVLMSTIEDAFSNSKAALRSV